jgi:hypothetical protein
MKREGGICFKMHRGANSFIPAPPIGRRFSRVQNFRSAVVALAILLFFPVLAPAVEQWGIFELALKGPTDGNPFTDVKFSAQFTQGTNVVEANGFYDGDGIYRVRFMPDLQGKWKYTTVSNVRKLNGQTGSFRVTKPSRQDHGPVRVARTYHFDYADGTPYEELGTTCYVWEWQPEPLQEQTLKTLAASPFNKIRFCVFPKRYVWNTNEPILYPFVSGTGVSPREIAPTTSPTDAGTSISRGEPVSFNQSSLNATNGQDARATTKNWDFARFNPKYFQHLEKRIADLQKLGIEADIILFHPYDEGHWGFDRMPADADDRYLQYIVARLSAYRNVWWSLANEWDFMRRKKEADFVRFGEIISRDDPYHHLLSIHYGSKLFDYNLPWITHASIQNGGAVTSPARARMDRDKFHKPVVYDEVQYEGNIPQGWGRLSAEELVFRFWNAVVAGTYCGHGETYKSDDQVLWWSKGGVLKGQSPARLAFLKKILADAPAEGIEPVDGHPEMGGQPGKYYLVYSGKQALTNWDFQIPKPVQDQPQIADGMKFTVEVLDTWNMTVTPVSGEFTLKQKDDSLYVDANGRSIPLPGSPRGVSAARASPPELLTPRGRPYIAIRIKRAGG